MSRLFFIRHGDTRDTGVKLSGRADQPGLTGSGMHAIQAAAHRLPAGLPIVSSPIFRARQSAEILASALSAPVELQDCFQEFDFGEWTGRTFEELESDVRWRRFNQVRSTAPTPGGETMPIVAARAFAGAERLASRYPGAIVVSHADVIRALVLQLLSMHFDLFSRLSIDTASITEVLWQPAAPVVVRINDRAHLEPGRIQRAAEAL